jgi:hypothetical protein
MVAMHNEAKLEQKLNVTQQPSGSLRLYTVFAAVGTLLTLVALWLDPRLLAGEPVWLKPLKFFLSTLIFVPTLEFALSRITECLWKVNLIRRVVASGLLLEMIIICGQALRGVKSHFNFATPIDGALFITMGIVITIVVLFVGWGGVLALRSRFNGSKALQQAVGWGLLVFVVAAFLGTQMPKPTPAQRALLESGQKSEVIGSHFVGSDEGATKLAPLTAWSVESGDLRVTHFVGMHVPQVLLALVWLMHRRRWNLSSNQAKTMVRVTAGLGFFAMAVTFVQAKLAQSVFSTGTISSWLLMVIAAITILIFLAAAFWPAQTQRSTQQGGALS